MRFNFITIRLFKNVLLSAAMILGINLALFAQEEVTVKGVVADADNQPLPGVSIVIKGTTTGTTSDFDGNYTIKAPSDATLVFSFIGYTPQEMLIGNQSEINITLAEDVEQLDEIVVVGYGVQKKSELTSSIARVKGDQLTKVNAPRVDQALQGQVSGVNIVQSSGQPGSGQRIVIRGVGTNGDSGPIFIVDGVVMNDMNSINPNDVESIEVLKDAASAAIYGARGANGVVLITTKKGEAGKATFSYDGFFGVQSAWKKPEVLNREQYITWVEQRAANDGDDLDEAYLAAVASGVETNWMDEIFENAPMQSHQISASTGGEKGTMRFSLAYLDQDGIIGGEKSNFKRYTTRLNGIVKPKEWLELGQNLSFSHNRKSKLGEFNDQGTVLSDALNMPPVIPIYSDNFTQENRGWGQAGYNLSGTGNPLSRRDVQNELEVDNKLFGNYYVSIRPIEGLMIRSDVGFDLSVKETTKFTPKYSFTPTFNSANSSLAKEQRNFYLWQWENVVSYTKKVGDHQASLMLGTTSLKDTYEEFFATAQSLAEQANFDENFQILNVGDPDAETVAGFKGAPHTMFSIFGRATYNYQSRYLLNVTVRRDGSSNFGPENKYGIFPSVSAGWVLSDESFWPTNDILDFAKLRASWGKNGNEKIDPFSYLALVAFESRTYAFTNQEGSESLVQGAALASLVNPAVKWEESSQLDIGVDFGMLDSKLNIALDYFDKRTIDLLLKPPTPALSGNDPTFENVGEFSNKGFEIEASYRTTVAEKVNINASFNATYLKNEVIELGDVNSPDEVLNGFNWPVRNKQVTRFQQGHSGPFFYGYKTDGIFQTPEDVYTYTDADGNLLQPDAQPGDLKYMDLNGDGAINDQDRTDIGSPWPDWVLGGSIGADFKGVDFSLVYTANLGNEIARLYERSEIYDYGNRLAIFADSWNGEGTSSEYPRPTTNPQNQEFSDFYVSDGSFFRIKTIQLGYTLPTELVEKAFLQKARVYVSVDNLLTVTGYDGFDPEVGGESDQLANQGVDRGFFPQARTIRTGLSLTF